MASFGAPIESTDHANKAVRAGLKIQRRLEYLNIDWGKRGLPELRCRIGIVTDTMYFGNLGSKQVSFYSPIGDPVNLSARLESANKLYGTRIMVSESALQNLTPGAFLFRVLDVIKVKGKNKAIKVYEIYGEGSEKLDPEDSKYYETYDEGFKAYLARNFIKANQKFTEALELHPGDIVSQNMIKRIESIQPEQLSEDWDGATKLTEK